MEPTADFDPSKVARSLLRRRREGALATLMAGAGDPYCSLVNLASHPDGTPILLISRLAVHTRNILSDPRVSLMLDERTAGDALEGARIMLQGRAEAVAPDELDLVRRRYLAAHPSAQAFVDFADFSFFKIAPGGAHLVAGFGRIVDLKPEQFLTEIGDSRALTEAEPLSIAHINADHKDTMKLCATRLLKARSGDYRCTSIDPDGIDLQSDDLILRLDFERHVTGPAELREMLAALAKRARAGA